MHDQDRRQTVIRLATPEDLEATAELLIAQLEEHDIHTGRDAITSALDGMLRSPDRGFVLLALREGTAVGVAYLAFNWTLEHGGKVVWLEELYVVPSLRGGGLGRRLLVEAMEQAKALGCVAVDLEVETSHDRAEHLYAREGFQPLTRRRWARKL